METPSEYLFSYGTLQQEAVQVSTFGRKLEGEKDMLPGFRESLVRIEDPGVVALSGKTHHPIVQATGESGDSVAGMVFRVTPQELLNADTYEVSAYKRISVVLSSKKRAWVYVDARHSSVRADAAD
jgi:hypothetical protein